MSAPTEKLDRANKQKTKSQSDKTAGVLTVIQINIFRYKNGQPNFLMLKRIDKDNDHFWQPISQPIEDDEPMAEVLQKAAENQVGISDLKYLSHELYKYEWYADGQRGRDVIFAGEVSPTTLVFPDLELYDTFAWMPYKEALLKLKWDGNKQSLRQLMDHLEQRERDQVKMMADLEKQAAMPMPVPSIPNATSNPNTASNRTPDRILGNEPSENDKTADTNPAHQSTRDLSDELIPNYRTVDDGNDNSVFPL